MNLKHSPYNLFPVFALIFIVTGFFFCNTIIDIHLHDTYFILQHALIFWSGTVIFLLLWGIYFATKRTLYSIKLTWIHVVFTITAVTMICASSFLINNTHAGLAVTPRRYYDAGSLFLKTMKDFSGLIFGLGLLFLAQVVLIMNVLLGLLIKKD